jgi:hypothetical protein
LVQLVIQNRNSPSIHAQSFIDITCISCRIMALVWLIDWLKQNWKKESTAFLKTFQVRNWTYDRVINPPNSNFIQWYTVLEVFILDFVNYIISGILYYAAIYYHSALQLRLGWSDANSMASSHTLRTFGKAEFHF